MDLAILILRVVLGLVMIPHGIYKFQKKEFFDEKWQEDYGFPRGSVLITGIVQIAGGIAILAGVFSSPAAVILTLNILVATYVSIWKHEEPFLSTPEGKGWDVNLLLIGALIALTYLGDGKFSLVEWMR